MSKDLRNDLLVISKLIGKKEKILDVGCGNGKLLNYFSKKKKCRLQRYRNKSIRGESMR